MTLEATSGSEWQSSENGRRYFHVGLRDSDGIAAVGPEAWDSLSWNQKFEYLTKRADLLVLVYMHKEGAISDEYFESRAAEIGSRKLL